MKKINSYQKGFSAVEGLLITLILVVIGFGGYYVWSKQKQENEVQAPVSMSSSVDENTPQVEDTKTTASPPLGLKEAKSTEYKFSYFYPDDTSWKAETRVSIPSEKPYQDGERINNSYVNYTGCGANCGLVFSLRVAIKDSDMDSGWSWGEVQMSGNSLYKLASKTEVTQDGVKGMRWEYEMPDNSADNIVYYYFVHNGFGYIISVNSNGSNPANAVDFIKEGDKIVSSLNFL